MFVVCVHVQVKLEHLDAFICRVAGQCVQRDPGAGQSAFRRTPAGRRSGTFCLVRGLSRRSGGEGPQANRPLRPLAGCRGTVDGPTAAGRAVQRLIPTARGTMEDAARRVANTPRPPSAFTIHRRETRSYNRDGRNDIPESFPVRQSGESLSMATDALSDDSLHTLPLELCQTLSTSSRRTTRPWTTFFPKSSSGCSPSRCTLPGLDRDNRGRLSRWRTLVCSSTCGGRRSCPTRC